MIRRLFAASAGAACLAATLSGPAQALTGGVTVPEVTTPFIVKCFGPYTVGFDTTQTSRPAWFTHGNCTR
jgi:hypothetical protein